MKFILQVFNCQPKTLTEHENHKSSVIYQQSSATEALSWLSPCGWELGEEEEMTAYDLKALQSTLGVSSAFLLLPPSSKSSAQHYYFNSSLDRLRKGWRKRRDQERGIVRGLRMEGTGGAKLGKVLKMVNRWKC